MRVITRPRVCISLVVWARKKNRLEQHRRQTARAIFSFAEWFFFLASGQKGKKKKKKNCNNWRRQGKYLGARRSGAPSRGLQKKYMGENEEYWKKDGLYIYLYDDAYYIYIFAGPFPDICRIVLRGERYVDKSAKSGWIIHFGLF